MPVVDDYRYFLPPNALESHLLTADFGDLEGIVYCSSQCLPVYIVRSHLLLYKHIRLMM